MTGIVNSTGARSGVIGTTVGTPVTDLSTATFPAGHVLQVKSTHDNTQVTFTMTDIGNTYTTYGYGQTGIDYTGVDVLMTPASASNKLLVTGKVSIGYGASGCYGVLRMKRSIGGTFPTFNVANHPWHNDTADTPGTGTLVGITWSGQVDNTAGQLVNEVVFGYLDSPNTTDEVRYTLNFLTEDDSSATTAYINGSGYRGTDYGSTCGTSYMVVQEVVA